MVWVCWFVLNVGSEVAESGQDAEQPNQVQAHEHWSGSPPPPLPASSLRVCSCSCSCWNQGEADPGSAAVATTFNLLLL